MNVLTSPYIVVPFVAWFIAQATKFAIKASSGDFSWKYFYKSGNMPSSHTAIVTALMVVLAALDGGQSPEFGIGAVFSLIVIYDALNVRRAVGEQGGVLARLVEITRTPKAQREVIKIREVLGHTPLEVAAGALIGMVTSAILMYEYWPEAGQRFVNVTTDTERTVYLVIFAVSLLVGIITNRFYNRRQYRKLPTSKRIQRYVRTGLITPAVLGLIALWLQSESIRLFTTKFWLITTLIWIVTGALISYLRIIPRSRAALAAERGHFKSVKKRQRKARTKRKHKRKK